METVRSDLKDILKKIYSFSTLEMDYYEKLLKAHEAQDTTEYKEYKNALSQIHRNDQYKIFKLSLNDLLVGALVVIHKFQSIIGNEKNLSELKKVLKSGHEYQY